MVAYFRPCLSDNYVDLSDLYVDLSDNYVNLSYLFVDFSLVHFFFKFIMKKCPCAVYAIQLKPYFSDKST
jgi:hypothetical protein